MAIAIGVDIGGTFTDLIAYDEAAGEIWHAKSSTTPHHLADAIFDCIAKAGLHPQSIFDVVHGTTVAINTAIERTGARTALLVTQGTRDVYAIGRGNRPEAYNIFFRRAEPLVPRHLTFEVQERLLASGEVLVPLNTEALAPVADQLKKEKVEAVAVCLLHAFTNPAHELAVGTFLQSSVGEACYLSLSHEIMRQYGEYERISTTVLNAYIGPKVKGYLEDLAHRLEQAGIQGHLYIMQSNGGVMTPETAMRKPVTLMESGPVGGIIASALVGSHLGFPNVIAFDMGGTTAKASLIQDGEPTMAPGYYIGGYASGHPA
ncbi:MAG: hydantoinase/oxoprolinase family protein, partial [Firmicutes bacterium]|nr:hydantoinase/oxoprolinase family protein [Bacillota bacterium]